MRTEPSRRPAAANTARGHPRKCAPSRPQAALNQLTCQVVCTGFLRSSWGCVRSSGSASASSGQWQLQRSSLAGSARRSTSSTCSAPRIAMAGFPGRCSTSVRAQPSSPSWRGPAGCRAAHRMCCSWCSTPTRILTAASGRVGGAALACCAGTGWVPPSRSSWAVSGVTSRGSSGRPQTTNYSESSANQERMRSKLCQHGARCADP